MAKITALTADASPTDDDLIVTVNDPAGTPANRKVTLADLRTALLSGASAGELVADIVGAMVTGNTETNITVTYQDADNTLDFEVTFPAVIGVACSDETTDITTGTAKATFRMPHAMTVTGVRATLSTASSSGTPTIDINDGGTTILSTKITIDANEKTSTTAAVAPVISDSALADDAEITIDIDVAGTGAKGLKVWIIGTRA